VINNSDVNNENNDNDDDSKQRYEQNLTLRLQQPAISRRPTATLPSDHWINQQSM